MIRRSTFFALKLLACLIGVLALALGLAWWRLAQGPVEVSFIRQQIQTELSAARSGRPVGIERVELGLSPAGTALELRAVGVSVEDGRGGVLSRAQEARIELAVLPLLLGRISVERAEFIGGEITFSLKRGGALHVAFGPEGAPPDIIVPPPPNESLEARVNRLLDGMEAAFRPVGAGGRLRALSLRGAKLAIVDEAGGGRWTAESANLELARDGASLALVADARIEAASGFAPASLRITTDTRFQNAIVEFGARDVRPRALLSTAALGPFAALDAPLTTTLTIGLDRQAGINRFEGEAVFGRGTAEMPGGLFKLDGGRVHGSYDFAKDELVFDQLALAGERTRINGQVRIRDASAMLSAAPDQPAAFDIALPSLTLDVPGTFSEAIPFTNVQIVGAIVAAERSIGFTRLRANTGAANLDLSGRLYWAQAGGQLRPGIELRGAVGGVLEVREVLRGWPLTLGEGIRAYLGETLLGGRVTEASVNIDVRPDDLAAEAFRNEAIDVRFNVANAEMRFVSTMSPVTAARGSGVLRGNRFDMVVPEARFNGLAVTSGTVSVPQFRPRGGMTTIAAHVEGDARGFLEVLMQQPLALGERLPITPASATGHGALNVRLQRPNFRDVPFEQWRFNIDGVVRDLAGSMSNRRMALSQGQMQVHGDQRVIVVSGPIRAGSSNIAEVRWVENLGRSAASSSEYRISGDFSADDLQRLGYPVARYAQGRIGIIVAGMGRGFDVDQANVELDLTNAAVEAPRSFWTKRAGLAAAVQFDVQRQRDGGLAFNGIDARGAGLNVQGRVRLARDNSVVEADLSRLAVEGRSDARLSARRVADGGVDVTIRGALFDAAPFMNAGDPVDTSASSAPQTPTPPLRASVIVDRMKMRGGASLAEARVSMAMARGALTMLTIDGYAPSRRSFSLGLGPREGNPNGAIVFRSEDAGFAVRAITGSENVIGGSASAQGAWSSGPPSSARFNVAMRDFQVVRLPAMAGLLSSVGSLRGMVDTLNGDGILFSAMEAQMTYANNRVAFTEGAMRGPALGLTGSGAYDLGRDNLDIDGVVAPSYGLNSFLGNVPLVGDLFVSRRGEGVIGMTYSIDGRAGAPRVGVNPLSAFTPGILRRIFEPPPTAAPPREGAMPAENTTAQQSGASGEQTRE